jgi:hypothetical protein
MLIGEEHGVAETAQLSAALFAALRASDYSRVAIELSPILAQEVMMKFGYNHMIRGANYVNAFDLGAMADEVAASRAIARSTSSCSPVLAHVRPCPGRRGASPPSRATSTPNSEPATSA